MSSLQLMKYIVSWSCQALSSILTRFPSLIIEKGESTPSRVSGLCTGCNTPLLELLRDITAIRSQHTHSGFLNHVMSLPEYGNMADSRIIGIVALTPSSIRPAPMVCYIFAQSHVASWQLPLHFTWWRHTIAEEASFSWAGNIEHCCSSCPSQPSRISSKALPMAEPVPATEDIYHSQYHSASVEWSLDALVLGCFELWHS